MSNSKTQTQTRSLKKPYHQNQNSRSRPTTTSPEPGTTKKTTAPSPSNTKEKTTTSAGSSNPVHTPVSKPSAARGGWAAVVRGGPASLNPWSSGASKKQTSSSLSSSSSTTATIATATNPSPPTSASSSSPKIPANKPSAPPSQGKPIAADEAHLNNFNSEEVSKYLQSQFLKYATLAKDRKNSEVVRVYKAQESGWGRIGGGGKKGSKSTEESSMIVGVLNEIAKGL